MGVQFSDIVCAGVLRVLEHRLRVSGDARRIRKSRRQFAVGEILRKPLQYRQSPGDNRESPQLPGKVTDGRQDQQRHADGNCQTLLPVNGAFQFVTLANLSCPALRTVAHLPPCCSRLSLIPNSSSKFSIHYSVPTVVFRDRYTKEPDRCQNNFSGPAVRPIGRKGGRDGPLSPTLYGCEPFPVLCLWAW